MSFFINKFAIISPKEKRAFIESFSNNINLLIGEKDSGKSTLVRSIFYTLGCDVKGFDFIDIFPENIYIIDFNINNDNYILIRKKLKRGIGKNFFKLIKNHTKPEYFHNTKNYKDRLNELLGIQLTVTDKKNNETKLYPNHIFLPFYTDQDNSWQNYLYSTFNGLNFISEYKKIILEYFTGFRSNKYYELKLKRDKLKNKKIELEALIRSKQLIIEENEKNIKIIENIDFEKFTHQYKTFLSIYENIVNTEHKLKKELNEKIYKRNSYKNITTKLQSSIDNTSNLELNDKCPNCNQKIFKDMKQNYKLYLTQENLIKEREKIKMYLDELDEMINAKMVELNEAKLKNSDLKGKLDSDSKALDMIERAKSYAFNCIYEKLSSEIIDLVYNKDTVITDLEIVEKELFNLNYNDIAESFKRLMINAFDKLEIPFSYNTYFNSNFESVNIALSGTTKVQAFIAQYLSIYELVLANEDVINIPMFIDTFLKDDFNDNDIENTSKFIFSKLERTFQSFIFISDNQQTLEAISSYHYNTIKLSSKQNLLSSNYRDVYSLYENLIEGE